MTLRRLAAVLTAMILAVLVTASGPGTTAAATAAEPDLACGDGGARVVIDFGDLVDGGPDASIRTACDDEVTDERADKTIADSGFALTYATRDQGFVCRVDGLPAEDKCVKAAPADAYWSVWWAAAGGDWVYSSRGVGTLRTPAGGHVALVWHNGDARAMPPSISPSAAGEIEAGPTDVRTNTGESEGQSLPLWVPALVVVAVLLAAGTVVVRRRES